MLQFHHLFHFIFPVASWGKPDFASTFCVHGLVATENQNL